MTRVAITSVISATPYGTIVGATDESGGSLRVRCSERIDLAIGDVVDVHGQVGTYAGAHGDIIQIEALQVERAPVTGRLIIPWLCGLPGIGKARARRLFDSYGDDLITALRDRDHLDEIAGVLDAKRPPVGAKLARCLFVHLASRDASEEIGMAEGDFMRRLESLGVDDIRAARSLWRLIGSVDAYDRLVERPYLAASILPWHRVDSLGRTLLSRCTAPGSIADHPDRLVGAVHAVWRDLLARGSTAADHEFMGRCLERLDVTPAKAIELAVGRRRARQTQDLLRAPGAAHLERMVADHIARLRATVTLISAPVTTESTFQHTRFLNTEQRGAVNFVSSRPLSILHGGAGVGKTTTMRAVCDTHQAAGGNVVLCAISGKAALRLSRATGRIAVTAARLMLAMDTAADASESSRRPRELSIDANTLLVVDEASMVDLLSWSRLLSHVPNGARVVLVGDPGQLSPVGLGRVFHDLVEDGTDALELRTVVRQGADNPIIDCAANVRLGRTPDLPPFDEVDEGVFHINCTAEKIETEALRVREKLERPGITLLTVAARNATCDRVARTIQTKLRQDGVSGARIGSRLPWVSIGEPVVVTANRYAEGLTNGLLGAVVTLDPPAFLFDGEATAREISCEAMWDLASAWCVTVHRAQGSEAEVVIVLLDGPHMTTREWLYTAITRATRQVIVIGPADRLHSAVARRESRTTGIPLELARIRALDQTTAA